MLFAMLMSLIVQTHAGEVEIPKYTVEKLKQAKESSDLIVLHIHAAWCPVCRKQTLVLKKLIPDGKFKSVRFMASNFDTDKDLNKEYGVTDQSTFLVFHGKDDPKKVSKSSFVTDEKEIREFIAKEMDRK